MADRVAHDHPTVETIRATATDTPAGVVVTVPPEQAELVPLEDVIRVVLDGDERFAQPERPLTGEHRQLPGVYRSPEQARSGDRQADLLESWVDEHDVRLGGSVLLDVVVPDFLYGLRAPGETARYEAREPPADSLQSIAENLEK